MKRSILIGIILTGLIVSIGTAAVYSYSLSRRTPSEGELPAKIILDNQKGLAEVKVFLTKYPDANIFVDRSGRLAVDYTVHHQVSDDPNDVRRLKLRVFSDDNGRPQEIYLDCISLTSGEINPTPDGKNAYLIFNDILNYIETEKCWTTPFSRQ